MSFLHKHGRRAETINAHFSASEAAVHAIDEFIFKLILLFFVNEDGISFFNSVRTDMEEHYNETQKIKVCSTERLKMCTRSVLAQGQF